VPPIEPFIPGDLAVFAPIDHFFDHFDLTTPSRLPFCVLEACRIESYDPETMQCVARGLGDASQIPRTVSRYLLMPVASIQVQGDMREHEEVRLTEAGTLTLPMESGPLEIGLWTDKRSAGSYLACSPAKLRERGLVIGRNYRVAELVGQGLIRIEGITGIFHEKLFQRPTSPPTA